MLVTPQPSNPFPWKCGHCRQRAVEMSVGPYSVNVGHDGRTYAVTIPDLEAPRCTQCGELVLDDAANQRISAAFRQHAHLLTPDQIHGLRESQGLTPEQFASRRGIAEATLSRWENGYEIQPLAFDRSLRL